MFETTLTLADGRSLGLAEWGPPDAPLVVYCHGFPGSRLEPSLAQAVVERRAVNARVIAFDRPGYGRSAFLPGRGFLDWPTDMAEAADRLGIDRFSVLGASGGCPYALACASSLGERVTRVGIVAGVGPLEATSGGAVGTPSPSVAEPRVSTHPASTERREAAEAGDRTAVLSKLESLLGDTVMRLPTVDDSEAGPSPSALEPALAEFLGVDWGLGPIDVSGIAAVAPLFAGIELGPGRDRHGGRAGVRPRDPMASPALVPTGLRAPTRVPGQSARSMTPVRQ